VKISSRVGVFNDGTELRINNIHQRDLGDYTCVARNGVGGAGPGAPGGVGESRIAFTAKVVMAGEMGNRRLRAETNSLPLTD